MSFLQPLMLLALPAIAIPIVIHLVHQRRHRVVRWGAMMFLLQGVKMSRGLQRLRQIILLALRTLAVLGLIVGIGRPIAGGWVGGLGGGRPDVVVVLLDRSASMGEELSPGRTKLDAGVEQLVAALEEVQAGRYVCIDSVGDEVIELESPADLADLPTATGTSSGADLPAMLERAEEHLRVGAAGRAELWVCSDLQVGDWRPEDGRWDALREAFLGMQAGVRLHVLSFSERDPANLSVRVERAERIAGAERTELSFDLVVHSAEALEDPVTVPVEIDLAGATSVVEVELVGRDAELRGHRIPLFGSEGLGWGVARLPGDASPEDDAWYFVHGGTTVQETLIVAERDEVAQVLRIAAEAPVRPGVQYTARVLAPEAATQTLDLTGVSVLLWHANLPTGAAADEVTRFVEGGGVVVFLPPGEPTGDAYAGVTWGPEVELGSPEAPVSPTRWRGEADLLREGDDGIELAVDELVVRLLREVRGDVTSLAGFADGRDLLVRAPTGVGGVYFLGTTPLPAASNLTTQGLVLVALVQRALDAVLLNASSKERQDAGAFAPPTSDWALETTSRPDALLDERFHHAGVATDGERYVALNRPRTEDAEAALTDGELGDLMPGVDVIVVAGATESAGLVEEIWRLFLLAMVIALVGEALLCLHERGLPTSDAARTPARPEAQAA